jgi:23S rRNA (guanosine2251-2'-O)-methyltransferase
MSNRVVYGIHSVIQLLHRGAGRVKCVYLQEDLGSKRLGRVREALGRSQVKVQRVDSRRLTELTGSDKHQGVAAHVSAAAPMTETEAADFLESLDNPLVLVLDGVQDPRNFGSILRTADGAGVDLVVIGRNRNVGFTPVVSKVAAGAAEVQPVAEVGNLARFLESLKERAIWIVGASDAAEQSLFDADLTGPVALVLGSEGQGLRRLTRERCDFLVSLPMHGSVESLNVAVAAGVGLFEAVRQRRARLAPTSGLR